MPNFSKKVMNKSFAMLLVLGLSSSVLAEDLLELPYDRTAYDEYFQTPDKEVIAYNGNLCYDIVNYPLVTYKKAYINDKELLKDFYIRKSAVDTYLMDADIASLPKERDIETLINDDIKGFALQEQAVESLFLLVWFYYNGEVVPKSDYEAVKYLTKLVDFYQDDPVKNEVYEDSFLNGVLFLGNPSGYSDDNPLSELSENEINVSLSKLAIAAGSLDMKAECLRQDLNKLNSWASTKLVLVELEKLADKGSRLSVRTLAWKYGELALQDPEKFNEQKQYWQQKESQLPKMKQTPWN